MNDTEAKRKKVEETERLSRVPHLVYLQDFVLSDTVSDLPSRISDVTAWQGLIPLAFFIISVQRPGTVVELGTHKGDSYCAFCQAVVRLNLDTRCYAIDTWEGDDHAGHYGSEILYELRCHHDPRYGHFSHLIQSSFDEALSKFPDGSIDLLHIDGMHTYEAVKHDFESWLPKLSNRSLVLFHDISVRDRDFGVFRFWDEISSCYPNLGFQFSNGLGILGVGNKRSEPIEALFSCSREERQILTNLFLALGERVILTGKVERGLSALTEKERETSRLLTGINERDSTLSALTERVRKTDTELELLRQSFNGQGTELNTVRHDLNQQSDELDLLRKEFRTRVTELETLRNTVSIYDGESKAKGLQIQLLHRQLEALTGEHHSDCARLAAVHAEVARLTSELNAAREDARQLSARIRSIYTSSSWRLTAPMRHIKRRYPAVRLLVSEWARALYRGLPLPVAIKVRIKGLLFAVFSPLLIRTKSYRAWIAFVDKQARHPRRSVSPILDTPESLLAEESPAAASSSGDHGDAAPQDLTPFSPSSELRPEISTNDCPNHSAVESVSDCAAQANGFMPDLLSPILLSLVGEGETLGAHLARVGELPKPCPDKGRLLMVDLWIPTPDRSSGSARLCELLKFMHQIGCSVDLLLHYQKAAHSAINLSASDLERYEGALRQIGVRLIYGAEQGLAELVTAGYRYGIVWLNFPEVAYEYLPWIRAHAVNAHVIFDSIDLHHLRFAREAEILGDPKLFELAAHYRKIEHVCASCADVTVAITERERALLMELAPESHVEVVPNVHEITTHVPAYSERKHLFFIGGFSHRPNVDAVLYFATEVFPSIRREIPDIEFLIVGSNMPDSIRALEGSGIRAIGYVEDPSSYFHTSRLFVVPLRYGAGMKGKLGQALSYGLPSVTTTIGAEGMHLEHGQHALIADTPDAFASAVLSLYRNPILWAQLSTNGLNHLDRLFSPRSVKHKLKSLLSGSSSRPRLFPEGLIQDEGHNDLGQS